MSDDVWDPFADPADDSETAEHSSRAAEGHPQSSNDMRVGGKPECDTPESLPDPWEHGPPREAQTAVSQRVPERAGETAFNMEAEGPGSEIRAEGGSLPPRDADGRRPLPEVRLADEAIVEWVIDAVDVFEAMLLPLAPVSEAAVRKQYKNLLLLVHPDKNQNPGATAAFRRLFGAMETLCDASKQTAALQQSRSQAGAFANSQPSGLGVAHGTSSFFAWDSEGGVRPWWEEASVDEMERAFREREDMLDRAGVFDLRAEGFLGSAGMSSPADGAEEEGLWLLPHVWIEPAAAGSLLDEAIFVDARDPGDFGVSHIPGAFSLPAFTFNLPEAMLDSSALAAATANIARTVIVYSDTGTRASRCVRVASTLRSSDRLEARRVVRLRGGLNEWKRRGLAVTGDRRTFFAGEALGTSTAKLR